jgi:DNA-binding GntR family transcriptional regulator
LAERVPYRGVRVLQLSNEEIVDAYAMRLLLETTAARVAAAKITREQVKALAEIVEKMKDMVTLNEMSSARQLSRTFHFSIIKAAGNPLMLRVYETVANTFPDWMLYEAMFRHPEALEMTIKLEYREHKAIVAALKAGDAELAAQRTAEHILSLGRELEEYCGIPAGVLNQHGQEILNLQPV